MFFSLIPTVIPFVYTVVNLDHGYSERGPVHHEQSDALYEQLSEIEINEPGMYEVPKAVSSDKSSKEEWADERIHRKEAIKGIQLRFKFTKKATTEIQ